MVKYTRETCMTKWGRWEIKRGVFLSLMRHAGKEATRCWEEQKKWRERYVEAEK